MRLGAVVVSKVHLLLSRGSSSDRIIVDPRLNFAKELIDELKNLQLEQDLKTGNIRVAHCEGQGDDLLSTCLAAANWWASQPRPNDTLRFVR